MALYATKDELNELTTLVRDLLGNVTTLDTTVGLLDTMVERINHLSTLKDVTITFITEGDLLQYGNDGTWHNISPALLADYISGEGGVIDTAVVKALIRSEGGKLFLSKLYDDVAQGIITFANGFKSNGMAYLLEGVLIGHFVHGMLGGSGALIDKNGNGEMTSLILREFLEVPELRFNRIDVVSGELWNSIAFGTIESVDVKNQIVTLKLEDGEYSGIHINDICRGIFHNIDGYNNTETGLDDAGFDKVQGFSTAYFTPIEILDARGKQFRYSLRPDTTQHPVKSMKFAVYGNFTDKSRQASAYANRTYKRYLKDVDTWVIGWRNIASQFGLLDGLNIPEEGGTIRELTGYGSYLTNVYISGALILFTPDLEAELKGDDAYSVNLTKSHLSVIVDNELNVLEGYSQLENLTFGVQAFRGKQELTYNDAAYLPGTYYVEWEAYGLTVTMLNGIFTVTKINSVANEPRVEMIINCEGETKFSKTITLEYNLQPNALWTTYNDNDNIPDRPTGDGTTNGWHRNYTASAIWMSTKSSIRVDDPNVQWGDPNRFRGATVAGKDGQYTRFAYTESSVLPATPVGTNMPPDDPAGVYTWTVDPPEGDVDRGIYVWQSTQTVYSDKSTSGWTTPFRLTGPDGKDGTDGIDIEFVYKLTQTNEPPVLLANSNRDDYTEPENGWYDNPQGVTEAWQYEWVAQRTKPTAPAGTGEWSKWNGPALWSKWGEKGMDGDGYEYVYFVTEDETIKPDTPVATGNQDEEYPKAFIAGVWTGGYWTDDPKGVREDAMAEWVSVRKKTDTVWSNFQAPALWAKWGETGLSGGNYQYRYKISATKPTIPTDSAAAGWDTNSELIPTEGSYVWQILRFANADGSLTPWSNLIRLTGADGKDGEDGNSIEFLYARTATNTQPATPATTQVTDWTGTGPDGTTWSDNPRGVSDALRYEWVTQRYKDKSTQQWGGYSTPGLWSVFADKGKDGDGYEYVYGMFASYDAATQVDRGEQYYPASPNYGPEYIKPSGGGYQADDHIPNKSCTGVSFSYTDNPGNVSDSMPYQICWTRKKENGVWYDWENGFIWTYKAKDGADGEPGDPGADGEPGTPGADGEDGYSITVSGNPASIRRSAGYLQLTSCTLRAIRVKANSSTTEACNGYFAVYYRYGAAYTRIASSSLTSSWTANWSSSATCDAIWFGFSTDVSPAPAGQWNVWAQEAPVVYDGVDGADGSNADSSYTIMRDRGEWRSGVTYYNALATTAMKGAGVSTIIHRYCISANTYEGYDYSGWSTNFPTSLPSGMDGGYILAYSYVRYTDGSVLYSYPISLARLYGTESASLSGIYYKASNSVSVPDSDYSNTTIPSISASNPYLYSYYYITKGTATSTSVKRCIAKYQDDYTIYENYDKLTIVDYVYYRGDIYLASSTNTSLPPAANSSYWKISSKLEVLTVNMLLANNAKLGQFNFSNNMFVSNNGSLSMNSYTGELVCDRANIRGTINATDGVFSGTIQSSRGNIGALTITSTGLSTEYTIPGGFSSIVALSPDLGGLTGRLMNSSNVTQASYRIGIPPGLEENDVPLIQLSSINARFGGLKIDLSGNTSAWALQVNGLCRLVSPGGMSESTGILIGGMQFYHQLISTSGTHNIVPSTNSITITATGSVTLVFPDSLDHSGIIFVNNRNATSYTVRTLSLNLILLADGSTTTSNIWNNNNQHKSSRFFVYHYSRWVEYYCFG